MDPADLARMLELMAAALRAMPAGAVPAGIVPVVPQSVAPLPVQGRTLSEWLDVHERQVLAKGYKPQTIRNRTASIRHLRRLWGDRPITALRAHEIISALRRACPAAGAPRQAPPPVSEQGIDVQTLLGHKHAAMTAGCRPGSGSPA